MLKPGPNIFLLTVSVERYTEDHRFMVRFLQQLPEIFKFAIVAFNRIDDLHMSKPDIRKKINESENLQELLQISSRRFVLFDNTIDDESQINDFVEMADILIQQNQPSTLTGEMFSGNAMKRVNTVWIERQLQWQGTKNAFGERPSLLQRICNIL